MRRALTVATLGLGVLMMIVGYFVLSAPWGASGVDNSNPRFQFAPLIVVVGIAVAFLSAVVYELLPGRREK